MLIPSSINRLIVLACVAGVLPPIAAAQDSSPPSRVVSPADPETSKAFPAPDVAEAVTTLLSQAYLTDAERASLRIEHGIWTDDDLTDPVLRARSSLARGAFWDASLRDAAATPEDRAEAMLLAGDPAAAIELLRDAATLRSVRLRGEALIDLGRVREAEDALRAVVAALPASTDADEVAEGVRGLVLLARLVGADAKGGMGYQAMLTVLGKARTDMNRLSWRANLAEALLLYEKDRYADTGKALEATLTLNPKSAQAWALLGQAAVDGFDFPRAEAIAARLDELSGEPGSPDAALIRAFVRLRQGEGEAAEAFLTPILERFPEHRRALAMHAAAAAARFDFAAADERLARIEALAPRSPAGYLAVGKAMAGARQYDEASRYLRTAVERAPDWAEPVVELGLSEMQAGKNSEALSVLEAAVALDRYNVRADNSLKLLRELAGYAVLESDHFIVRHKPGQDEVVAREMLPVLERIFARVTGDGRGGIDHVPPGKTVVELYPDHHWFSVRITGMPRLHTIAAATGPVIAMEAPREGPGHKAGPYDWARVVQHEYTHTVTLSRTKNRLPHWFTEAGAVLLEDAPRDWNTVQLLARAYETDSLFDFDEINAAFVRPRKQTDRGQAYAQGHWWYEYILERWGNKAPLDLMDLYASGVREEAAFQRVLGLSRDQFAQDFRVWADEQLEAWGMRPSPQTPDVPMLLEAERAKGGDAPDEPTPELTAAWLSAHPDNPFVLDLAVRAIDARGGIADEGEAALCERYAKARPVDARPRKLLAVWAIARGNDALAVANLEWLDAREQNSTGYAVELARRYAANADMSRAQSKAARAVQIAPYDATIREFAATIALRAKDPVTAERHIEALTVLEPDREVHRQRLAAVRKMLGKE